VRGKKRKRRLGPWLLQSRKSLRLLDKKGEFADKKKEKEERGI